MLDAGTQGMIGYLIQRELRNLLPADRQVATLLTMITVDPAGPAFAHPAKFVGPVSAKAEAGKLAAAKDLASELLAEEVAADLLLMATDVDGVYVRWGTPRQRRLGQLTPQGLAGYEFAAGSMGPEVLAASRFAARTGRRAAIGSLADIGQIVAGTAGTNVVGAHAASRA